MYLESYFRARTIRIWCAFVFVCSFSTMSSFADMISIPGTSVSLDAPDGFTVASSFSGLENLQDGSSVTITELPIETYSQFLPIFSDLDTAISSFRQQSVSIARAETFVVGRQQIPVLIGSQSIPGGEVGKYLALYRGDVAVMLTFNIFDPRILTPAIVETVIKSVRLAPAATLQEKVRQLRFSFQVTAPFRLGDVLGGSSALIPSFEGTDPTGLRPLVLIVRSPSAITPSSNVELVARQLLRGTQGFENAEVTNIEEAEFGGGIATYLEAVIGNRTIVQFLRIPPDGTYVRLVAFGETTELNQVMSAITEIAGSVVTR